MTSNGLPDNVINKITEVFKSYYQVEKVVLYGSRAKGTYKNGSDIDLTMFGDVLTDNLLLEISDKLDELLLPYMIDLSIFNHLNNDKLKEHITRVGVVFYERNKELKQGWELKKIEEVCLVFEDGDWVESKDQSQSGIRLIQTGNVGAGYFKDREEKARYISEDTFKKLKCTEIFENDCLISRLPDPVGRACILPKTNDRMITAVDCSIIRFNQDTILSKWFLFYSLSNKYHQQINSQISGATRQRISRKNLGKINIPIPPLPEQQKIVSILDKTFSAIEQVKQHAEQNLKNAKELFDSYLTSIFTNKGEGWEEKPLKALTIKIGSGATPRGGQENYKSEGISLVRSMNVFDWKFKERNLAFIDEKQARELDGVTLHEGDVLLNITGASVARCCVFPKKYLPARVNQHVSIIRPKKELLDSHFLNFLLTSKQYKDRLLFTGEQGATRQAITKAQIESFKISIPTFKEQQSIVLQLDAMRVETKQLEEIYQQKITKLEELKKSILQKAFNGTLKLGDI